MIIKLLNGWGEVSKISLIVPLISGKANSFNGKYRPDLVLAASTGRFSFSGKYRPDSVLAASTGQTQF